MALKYLGKTDVDWIPGVPARDLTDEEVKQYPEAKRSAFYEEKAERKASKPRAKRAPRQRRIAEPVTEPQEVERVLDEAGVPKDEE